MNEIPQAGDGWKAFAAVARLGDALAHALARDAETCRQVGLAEPFAGGFVVSPAEKCLEDFLFRDAILATANDGNLPGDEIDAGKGIPCRLAIFLRGVDGFDGICFKIREPLAKSFD